MATASKSNEVVQPAKEISEVIKEIRSIREKVLKERSLGGKLLEWNDILGNETFVKEMHTEHPQLGNGYPVLLRDIVHNERFSIRACQQYFKWVSTFSTTNTSDNVFLRIQAEYVYFTAKQLGKGRAISRSEADASYKELLSEDVKTRKIVDDKVNAYYASVAKAKHLIVERLKQHSIQAENGGIF